MVTIEEAFETVIRSAKKLGKENINLIDTEGRVLAEVIKCDMDIPSFDKSAMDGYACRMDDLKNELDLIEIVPAGRKPEKSISKNQCTKIMTGAMIPEGADCVIMVEYTKISQDNKVSFLNESTNINIRYRAEDVKKGDVVLKEGTIIKPQHAAMLATVGCVDPLVYKRPKVGVISTGDELVEPDQVPDVTHIRNSNAYQLLAQIKSAGAVPDYYGIARDTESEIKKAITTCFKNDDIIILTGGVSEGDFDLVPEVFASEGIKILFESIAIQPGRPTLFGIKGDKYFFGLPGNPVSSFVQFEILIKPLIYKMMGGEYKNILLKLPASEDYKRKRAYRKSLVPIMITEEGKAKPLIYHGSADIHSYNNADGLMIIEEGISVIKEGDSVNVRLL